MEQDDQTSTSTIKDAVMLPTIVSSQLSQLTFNLGGMWERQVRYLITEQVQTIDLVFEHNLPVRVEILDELVDRLDALDVAVVDRLEVRHSCDSLISTSSD
jgi:hypothetical protein